MTQAPDAYKSVSLSDCITISAAAMGLVCITQDFQTGRPRRIYIERKQLKNLAHALLEFQVEFRDYGAGI